jgi:hypothetical protein
MNDFLIHLPPDQEAFVVDQMAAGAFQQLADYIQSLV